MSYSGILKQTFLLIMVLLTTTSVAGAQRAVLLPLEGSAALASQRDEVLLTFVTVLHQEGFDAAGPDARALDLLACETGACTETVLSGLSADFGVALALWARARGGRELAVTLYMPDGTTRDLSAALEDDVGGAARALAVDAARIVRAFEPEANTEADPQSSASRASPLNVVLGVAGYALAVPLLTSATLTLVRRGDCVSTESRDCDMPAGVTTEIHVGPRTTAFVAIGAGLGALSTYVVVKRPIRVAVSPRDRGLLLSTHVTF